MGRARAAAPAPDTAQRRPSFGALGSLSSRISAGVAFSYEPAHEEAAGHFLDACHLCRRPLGRFCDIFMYRGNTPFCSEDCRQEQIDLDLGREEEAAGYHRNRRRRSLRASRRVKEPAKAAADAQSIPSPATETTVAG